MDVYKEGDAEELKRRFLLFGVVAYAAGSLGENRSPAGPPSGLLAGLKSSPILAAEAQPLTDRAVETFNSVMSSQKVETWIPLSF